MVQAAAEDLMRRLVFVIALPLVAAGCTRSDPRPPPERPWRARRGCRRRIRASRASTRNPHWGKLRSLKAPDFPSLYPRRADVRAVRESLDPDGRMLNAHLREAFGA
jgi:hypothetical protein